MSKDFLETDAGTFIGRAKCFLEAARVLDDKMLDGRSGMLFAPALHLAGHGLELLLKGCLIHNGLSKMRVVGFGHRINEMWAVDLVEPLRLAAGYNAGITHQEAVACGLFQDAKNIDNPREVFEEYRSALGDLHAETKVYPIRYPTEDERVGPKTPLLVGTLWRTADDYVKRPDDFRARNAI
ncbi:hypothetical protein [Rhizobium bangladeshense]|uniref:hypothetical protein n=1 Tax=Rhizobium bangladeshense TaxID=1138189 RepID=UPI001C83BAFF|nr:hypothetical protein [Rhizobium bangladeshense]MBX4894925.1 hypothetical protein [Rhizobium bangladeshense]